FALHPDFTENGRLYVSYAAPLRDDAPEGWNYTRRISELTLAPDAESIDLGTERTLIELDWPSRKHNGGGLAFGPDGFLHIGLGDGGGAHGVGKEVIWSAFEVPKEQLYWDRLAQDTSSLFGSILRIDIDRGFPGYGIPDSNPFVGKPGRDEIYAFGFRNPYRIAFDGLGTSDFLVTAIAETLWEAIYLVSSPGNFGWPIREGTHCVDRTAPREPPSDCPTHGVDGSPIQEPIVEYPNMQVMHPDTKIEATGIGTAVVGGRIYRGSAIPDFEGKLAFADWSAVFERPSGQLFLATPPTRWRDLWSFEKIAELDTRIISVAEDAEGELYILTNDELGPFGETGKIFKILPADN
ncbi:MAG: PQQ-dependent sugar dehydrogenase, partial [Alphaproteobacteria bacterium]|nr:PQQ-dependent sugar dehydrogenase [Alphaproteobacteria bacterium]